MELPDNHCGTRRSGSRANVQRSAPPVQSLQFSNSRGLGVGQSDLKTSAAPSADAWDATVAEVRSTPIRVTTGIDEFIHAPAPVKLLRNCVGWRTDCDTGTCSNEIANACLVILAEGRQRNGDSYVHRPRYARSHHCPGPGSALEPPRLNDPGSRANRSAHHGPG